MTGLTNEQVAESRRAHGSNTLTPPKKASLWLKFFAKFSDPLIIILLVAGALSIGISIYEFYGNTPQHGQFSVFFEPLGIIIAIVLATGLAFLFEMKADKEFSILNQVNDDEPVKVIRNGNTTEIPKKDVVVGDIVVLTQGDDIPADGTLMEAVNLSVNESSLTGEPISHKTTDSALADKDATYPSNTVLRGTTVMEGHGIFRVEKVGDSTENGKVYKEAQIDSSVRTPLNEQLDRLGRLISIASYVIAALIVAGRIAMYFMHFGFDWIFFTTYLLQTIMIAVTLVVVAVPEGLPMAVTLSLAYSMRRMLKTNNLVRKMHACETMGATTVICTDKTGTLTQNQMQVHQTDFYCLGPSQILTDSAKSKLIEEGIAVNSTGSIDESGSSPKAIGNPTEGALLLWLRSEGIDYRELKANAQPLAEIPFSTERKYMATIVKSGVNGKIMLYVKGAPEIVCGLCTSIEGNVPKEQIDKQLLAWQNQGMRTLGFACQELSAPGQGIEGGELNRQNLALQFQGCVAISDPVRADVPDAIRECLDAGIAVKIVTGDTPATAKEIAKQISLWTDADNESNIIVGTDLANLTDAELADRIMELKIIARARPADKKRLVEALQKKNQVVAVTGDGTNDAPALKAAHVGLSMGDGTSVAKEASDITIIDNSFSSIGRAVMWGRSLYRNIQRFILFQLTVNVAACLIVLVGAFMGTESPLTVTQMLWVNLIMDTFAAMALASLPPSSDVMREPPRDRNAFIISRAMGWDILGTGLLFFSFLLMLLWVFENFDIASASALFDSASYAAKSASELGSLTPTELSLFFTTFVFLQFWNMFNARAFMTGRSAFHLRHCGEFGIIALAIACGQILIVTFGFNFFNVVPLSAADWAIIIGGTSVVLWVGEIRRAIYGRNSSLK